VVNSTHMRRPFVFLTPMLVEMVVQAYMGVWLNGALVPLHMLTPHRVTHRYCSSSSPNLDRREMGPPKCSSPCIRAP
jgi:hypothetical protein